MIKYHRFGVVSLITDDKRFLIQKTHYDTYVIYDTTTHDFLKYDDNMLCNFGRLKYAKWHLQDKYYRS